MGLLGLLPDSRGYVHPSSEEEIVAIIREARAKGMAVRVCGSAHSVPGAIHADARLGVGARPAIEMMLDRYAGVTFDEPRRRVTVQAGCRFGHDPADPTGRSTVESGLCFQLDRRGWALPNLPGVTHPTIAGFLSTGAAGASATHGLEVVAMRIVDGTGAVHELSREVDVERFEAALVSLGLLGILSTVTLQAVERFDVIGSETVTSVREAPFRLLGEGDDGIAAFLLRTPYARVLWWPQRDVDKLSVWQARRMEWQDYDDETGLPWALRPRPYHAFEPIFGSTLPLQAAAAAALTVIGGWRAALEHAVGPLAGFAGAALAAAAPRLEAGVIRAFVGSSSSRRFWDAWWRALPMDDSIEERLLPTTFTEVWLPLSSAGEAMRRLDDLFRRDPSAAGSFVVEIYASGPSAAWLSPAGSEPAVRLNFFWLVRNPDDPRDVHFPKLWEALADLRPRPHWAKLLPHDARASAERLAELYPRWQDFARLRAELDPDGIFLTSYWRAHLGLGGEDRPVAPLPRAHRHARADEVAPKWPLLFHFGPADTSLYATAQHLIDARGYVPAPIEEVAHAMWFDVTSDWLVAFVGLDWLTEKDVPEGAIVDMTFAFMTMRGRVIELEWPRRWAANITDASLPLATSMVEGIDMVPTPDGGTDVRWRIAYDVPPALAPFNLVIKPFFQWMFQRSLENLARYLGKRRRPHARQSAVQGRVGT